MVFRAGLVWIGILMLAIINAGLREGFLTPRFGDVWGRATSTIILCSLVVTVAFLSVPWIGARGSAQAFRVGLIWTSLTLAFEFLAGHFVFGNAWESLIADYNLANGRIWILVPISTWVAPIMAARQKKNTRR